MNCALTRCRLLLIAGAVSLLPLFGAGAAEELGPTHEEIAPIKFEIGPGGKIETMAMTADGNLICGVSWTVQSAGTRPAAGNPRRRPGRNQSARNQQRRPFRGPPRGAAARKYAVKLVTPAGKVTATWPLSGIVPKMIHGCDDGVVFVGGGERLATFGSRGKLLKSVRLADVLGGKYKTAHVSGVTGNKDHFFVAFGDGFSLRATEDIVRFDRDFGSAKLIVNRQFGCCGHIDLDTKGDVLLVAENSRHRVNRFTFDGEKLGTWGRRNRTSIEGFAACCNPVNFDFGPGGVLYTAESGIGRVKKYTPDGEYLGMVGYVDTTKFDRGSRLAAQSCYIPIEVSRDGKRVYVMDVRAHIIRVLAVKENAGG